MASAAQCIPSSGIAALVLRDRCFRRHEGPVARGESGIQKEWLSFLRCVVDKAHGVIADCISQVIVLIVLRYFDGIVAGGERSGIKVTCRTVDDAVVPIESALKRIVMLA